MLKLLIQVWMEILKSDTEKRVINQIKREMIACISYKKDLSTLLWHGKMYLFQKK